MLQRIWERLTLKKYGKLMGEIEEPVEAGDHASQASKQSHTSRKKLASLLALGLHLHHQRFSVSWSRNLSNPREAS